MTEPTLQEALARIDAQDERIISLELQVAELKGIKLVSPKQSKPVNMPAFVKAVDALAEGDHRPMREYLRYYTTPSSTHRKETVPCPKKITSLQRPGGSTVTRRNSPHARRSALASP